MWQMVKPVRSQSMASQWGSELKHNSLVCHSVAVTIAIVLPVFAMCGLAGGKHELGDINLV